MKYGKGRVHSGILHKDDPLYDQKNSLSDSLNHIATLLGREKDRIYAVFFFYTATIISIFVSSVSTAAHWFLTIFISTVFLLFAYRYGINSSKLLVIRDDLIDQCHLIGHNIGI